MLDMVLYHPVAAAVFSVGLIIVAAVAVLELDRSWRRSR